MASGVAAGGPTAVTTGQAGEAPRGPIGETLCGDPIGTGTTSVAFKNSKFAPWRGPSRSAKGKAVSSKMTCLEMMTQFVEKSRQRYPLW